MALEGVYNKGLWVNTGYEWENYEWIPDWVEWDLTGENVSFGRPIGKFWDESAFDDWDWSKSHFANKGGGTYFVDIHEIASKMYTDEGVCYLTKSMESWVSVGY